MYISLSSSCCLPPSSHFSPGPISPLTHSLIRSVYARACRTCARAHAWRPAQRRPFMLVCLARPSDGRTMARKTLMNGGPRGIRPFKLFTAAEGSRAMAAINGGFCAASPFNRPPPLLLPATRVCVGNEREADRSHGFNSHTLAPALISPLPLPPSEEQQGQVRHAVVVGAVAAVGRWV